MPAERVSRAEAAAIADLSEATIARYERLRKRDGSHPFPRPFKDGQYSKTAVVKWRERTPRAGAASAGVPRERGQYPCEDPTCNALVARRWRDDVTGDLLCKPTLRARQKARRDAGETVVPPR